MNVQVVKEFVYDNRNRSSITLSDAAKIRLDGAAREVLLKKDPTKPATVPYPTDEPLTARLPLFQPTGQISWDLLEESVDKPANTGIDYRVNDGASDLYWSGSAWVVPVSGQWNSMAEINLGLSSFPPGASLRKLQLLSRLQSTDGKFTPKLKGHTMLWTVDIDFVYHALYELVAQDIAALTFSGGIHTIETLTEGVLEIDLSSTEYEIRSDYSVSAVTAVYNLDTDPNRATNLFSSYNVTTKIVTLTTAQASGELLEIQFSYTLASVVAGTRFDYSELSKVPSVVLSDINFGDTWQYTGHDYVRDIAAGTAVGVRRAVEADLEIQVLVVTDKSTDNVNISEGILSHFRDNTQLLSAKLDDKFDVLILDLFDFSGFRQPSEQAGNVFVSQARIVIPRFPIVPGGTQNKFLVQTVKPVVQLQSQAL